MTADPLNATTLGARLRESGFRVTGPRLVVYRALVSLTGHPTADDVAAEVAAAGAAIPRTSVYNALKALVDAGLIVVADAGPGTTRYEIHGRDHDHFICRVCGGLSDVPPGPESERPAGTPPGRHALSERIPGAVIESAQLILRGVCAGCVGVSARMR